MSFILLILLAFAAIGGGIGYLKGKKVNEGKNVGVYVVAGAGIGFAVALVGGFLLIMLLLANLPVC